MSAYDPKRTSPPRDDDCDTLYNHVKGGLTIGEHVNELDSWLRNAIETQPYTTAVVALGIGWLLGRMHRPL
jgi:hypothetical protein